MSGIPVHPALARFTADLSEAIDRISNDPTHNEYFELFENTQIQLSAYGELIAKFWEEGIEFYPKDEKKA